MIECVRDVHFICSDKTTHITFDAAKEHEFKLAFKEVIAFSSVGDGGHWSNSMIANELVKHKEKFLKAFAILDLKWDGHVHDKK